jgi:hypothetical protein
MKTILEFGNEMMEKKAIDAISLPAYMIAPPLVGALAGKLYSDAKAPPARKYESFQADLLREKLKNILEERNKKKKLSKLEEVLNGTGKSIRL